LQEQMLNDAEHRPKEAGHKVPQEQVLHSAERYLKGAWQDAKHKKTGLGRFFHLHPKILAVLINLSGQQQQRSDGS